MRILINALSARQGGGQTYLRHLLDKFPEDKNKIFIISPDTLELPTGRMNIERVSIPGIIITNPFIRALWETFVQPKLLTYLKIDILFCPGGSVTGRVPSGCRVVTTFQNMMPFDQVQRSKYPLGYMRFRNWLLERKLLSSMIRSDLVIFISEFAKSVIKERSKDRIRKSVIIPHGINPDFRRDENAVLPVPGWLPTNGYLLYVSILDVYKSQVEVIQAYAELKLRRNDLPKLILIGPEYTPYGNQVREAISQLGLANDVIIKSAISNHDLPAIYQNALVNIFASQTENCPFILLEGLASGRPMLVSNYPPMPEFGGDAVEYFNPSKPSELALKLENLLNDTLRMSELSKRAMLRSLDYNWDKAAQSTWQAIENLV